MDQASCFFDHLLLDGLPAREAEWLSDQLELRFLNRGQVLVQEGAPPGAAWFLRDATAAILMKGSERHFPGLGVIGKGHVAGATVVLGPQPSPWRIETLRAGTAYYLAASATCLATHAPVLFDRLGWTANDDIGRLSRLALELPRASATRRVASAIEDLFIATEELLIETTHDRLAEWLCVRRATVTLALQDLESARAIKNRRGMIELLDHRKLCAIATGAIAPESASSGTSSSAP